MCGDCWYETTHHGSGISEKRMHCWPICLQVSPGQKFSFGISSHHCQHHFHIFRSNRVFIQRFYEIPEIDAAHYIPMNSLSSFSLENQTPNSTRKNRFKMVCQFFSCNFSGFYFKFGAIALLFYIVLEDVYSECRE